MIKVILEINVPELTEDIANVLNDLVEKSTIVESWEEVIKD